MARGNQLRAWAGELFTCKVVVPLAFREPDHLPADPARPRARLSDRRDKHPVSEEILLTVVIGFFRVRIFDIHWPRERHRFPARLSGTRVDIGEYFRAKLEAYAHGVLGPLREFPGPPVVLGAARRVRPQNRARSAKLAPAHVGLLVSRTHVAAYVVRPEESIRHCPRWM